MRGVGRTDIGLVRDENQDVFAVREDLGLGIVADGVARPRAGRIAAETAMNTILEYLGSVGEQQPLGEVHLRRGLEIANDRVFGLSSAISAYRGMAATVVATVVDGTRALVAHVGDSRAYRLRDNELTAITKDHSAVQELVDEGLMTAAQARTAPDRHVVTRAIGAEQTLRPDVRELKVLPDDLLLLCSDGLTEHLDDSEIQACLAAERDLGKTADRLVGAAIEAGGSDNVTVVLVRC